MPVFFGKTPFFPSPLFYRALLWVLQPAHFCDVPRLDQVRSSIPTNLILHLQRRYEVKTCAVCAGPTGILCDLTEFADFAHSNWVSLNAESLGVTDATFTSFSSATLSRMDSTMDDLITWIESIDEVSYEDSYDDCEFPYNANIEILHAWAVVTGMVVDDVAWSDVCMHAADSVTRAVLKHLPFVKDVFRNKREDYHLTIWHTSKAMYPCPDATHKTGGVDPGVPPGERPAPAEVRGVHDYKSLISDAEASVSISTEDAASDAEIALIDHWKSVFNDEWEIDGASIGSATGVDLINFSFDDSNTMCAKVSASGASIFPIWS